MTSVAFIPGPAAPGAVSIVPLAAPGGPTGPTGLGYWGSGSIWHPYNPVDEAKLKPYFPEENPELESSSKQASIVSAYIDQKAPLDIITLIFSYLNNPEDVANAASVCKRFYAATKNPVLWHILLSKNLPNVKVLKDSTLSPEQQVKIVFQRIFAELKQISEAESSLKIQYNALTAPNGLIVQAEAFVKQLALFANGTPQINDSKSALTFAENTLNFLKGSKPKLEEGLEQFATFKQETYAKYDNQEKAKELIQSVETKSTLPTQSVIAQDLSNTNDQSNTN